MNGHACVEIAISECDRIAHSNRMDFVPDVGTLTNRWLFKKKARKKDAKISK